MLDASFGQKNIAFASTNEVKPRLPKRSSGCQTEQVSLIRPQQYSVRILVGDYFQVLTGSTPPHGISEMDEGRLEESVADRGVYKAGSGVPSPPIGCTRGAHKPDANSDQQSHTQHFTARCIALRGIIDHRQGKEQSHASFSLYQRLRSRQHKREGHEKCATLLRRSCIGVALRSP
jgi:hypothetical protein